MWECITSRANLDLVARGNVPRVRVLPGASALAELAAALWDGNVPGLAISSPGGRVRLLFADDVHLSDVGRYYIALVHYAVLFGSSPEGAAIPKSISQETGRYMQTLAWRFALSYGERADAASRRDRASCRALMQDKVCPAYAAFWQGSTIPVLGTLMRHVDTNSCRRDYGDAQDPHNPFASP